MALVKRAAWLSWIAVILLAGSCCVLAALQYRWISEFSSDERARLAADLEGRLNLLARSFNEEISRAATALAPRTARIDSVGRERAYAESYERFRQSHEPLFQRIALAIPGDGAIALSTLNLDTGEFSRTEWPAEWSVMRERLEARLDHRSSPPLKGASAALLEMPRFGEGGEQEWLIVELNVDYVRNNVLPELLKKYVGNSGRLDYDWDLVTDPSDTASPADASVALLNIQPRGPDNGRGGPGPPRAFPDRSGRGGRPEPRGDRGPPPNFSSPRWRLDLRHHAGSLEAFVAQAKRRNVAVSAGLLLLILATVFALLRATRQSQRLAAAQMNFVASVSHELRTPLSVIRTAAFNLKRSVARRPEQVEQYGQLIQEQAEKLTALVEQVLRFARTESGHVIGKREPVRVDELIEDTLEFGEPLAGKGITIEKNLQAGLPPVLADRLAMKHALQNLIENAVKYGGDWVGVSAAAMAGSVEIRVADRGPGIPDDEQPHIFDPFFRGRRALSNQVHGTGLGLSLVKKIIEAHGGTIRVESRPMQGSEFIVCMPAAPTELSHELAHSVS